MNGYLVSAAMTRLAKRHPADFRRLYAEAFAGETADFGGRSRARWSAWKALAAQHPDEYEAIAADVSERAAANEAQGRSRRRRTRREAPDPVREGSRASAPLSSLLASKPPLVVAMAEALGRQGDAPSPEFLSTWLAAMSGVLDVAYAAAPPGEDAS